MFAKSFLATNRRGRLKSARKAQTVNIFLLSPHLSTKPADHAGFFICTEFIMNYSVSATHAVTADGEWVTPESVQQVDFDPLRCIYCKLKIGVQYDPLTATRSFTHLLGNISNVSQLQSCRFNKPETIPEQTIFFLASHAIPPPGKRLRPDYTTVQQWRCCWCHVRWHGEKVCPQCDDWIYSVDT